ncbi:MAG: ABC transporter ATP-binding protein [Clostridia bacterium]|nr:ABC transporter ATP-binding protein [Clostridia bacterium]
MALLLKNVCKTFEDTNTTILNNINFEMESGEFLCVVGRSGCGKSTLLNLIAGLERLTSGEITLNGKKIDGPGADRAVMFQENALYPWLNVMGNVKFGMEIAGVSKEEQEERALKYLRMMQMEEYKDYAIHQLSGGMRQRVALARAFTLDFEMILMDEPFSALDKKTSGRLREELQSMWMETKKTVFFITHSVEEAVYLGTRVAIMSEKEKTVREIIPIELERPRREDDEAFISYKQQILEAIESEGAEQDDRGIEKK